MKRKLLIMFLGILILLCVLFPSTVICGAKEGLHLWFYTVMPSLLPFMILSVFMMKGKITEPVSRFFGPVLSKVFSMPYRCSYPVVTGFLSGYPVGAKVTGQMYLQKEITKNEAQYLLSFCNNASPMFLISFIGVECLHLKVPAEVFFIIFLSAWFSSFYTRKKYHMQSVQSVQSVQSETGKGGQPGRENYSFDVDKNSKNGSGHLNLMEALDESILDAFVTMAKIGGYILLFSVVIRMLLEFIPGESVMKYLVVSFLEITTGGTLFSKITLEPWLQYSIFLGLCAFGGISNLFQTASVISETDLSMKEYFFAKCRQFVIAFLLGALFLFWKR